MGISNPVHILPPDQLENFGLKQEFPTSKLISSYYSFLISSVDTIVLRVVLFCILVITLLLVCNVYRAYCKIFSVHPVDPFLFPQ